MFVAIFSTAVFGFAIVVAVSPSVRRRQAEYYLRRTGRLRVPVGATEEELVERYRWRAWAGVALGLFVTVGLWTLVIR